MAASRHKFPARRRLAGSKRRRTHRQQVRSQKAVLRKRSFGVEASRVRPNDDRKARLLSSSRLPEALRLPPGDEAQKGRETVLVVGKTLALSSLMAKVLRRYGYQVMEASDALDALRLTQARPAIELALIDLSSSEPGPFQLALWLRAMHPDIKVLLAADALWDVGLEVGASQHIACLAKPFTPIELASTVRRVLDRGFAA